MHPIEVAALHEGLNESGANSGAPVRFEHLGIVEVREASAGGYIGKRVRAQEADRNVPGNGQEEQAARVREGGRYIRICRMVSVSRGLGENGCHGRQP